MPLWAATFSRWNLPKSLSPTYCWADFLILQRILNSPCFIFPQKMAMEHVPLLFTLRMSPCLSLHMANIPLFLPHRNSLFSHLAKSSQLVTLLSAHHFRGSSPMPTQLVGRHSSDCPPSPSPHGDRRQQSFSHAHTASGGTRLTVLLFPAHTATGGSNP